MKIAYDRILYLDADFISSKYEEITKVSPSAQFSKTEGMKAGGGLVFLKADVHTQETRTFTKSSVQMLQEIQKDLAKYPNFCDVGHVESLRTQISWVRGLFTIGGWKTKDPDTNTEQFKVFELMSKEEPHVGSFSLVVQPENFKSNVDAFLAIDSILTGGIGFEVTALVKILYYADKVSSYIACPYLIVEQ
jgi:hypothetical protein